VVETIEDALRKDGLKRSEIAILYRSNAQSRVLEEALLREKIPYRIYGGQRFFERAEIKNAMAYLRLLDGRGNDAALERIINVPARGIGEKTIETIREYARAHDVHMWEAIRLMLTVKALLLLLVHALHGLALGVAGGICPRPPQHRQGKGRQDHPPGPFGDETNLQVLQQQQADTCDQEPHHTLR
jgi:superfamily I DNA/RNA helicase